jgi:hypothetical protein
MGGKTLMPRYQKSSPWATAKWIYEKYIQDLAKDI